MKKKLAFGIVMVLLLASVGTVSAANLVQNGGFEDPKAVGEFTPNMASGLTNWNIEAGNIDLIGSHWKAYENSQSIDLRGCSIATISQQILNTDPQVSYQLLLLCRAIHIMVIPRQKSGPLKFIGMMIRPGHTLLTHQ